jgi:hypothetical protein
MNIMAGAEEVKNAANTAVKNAAEQLKSAGNKEKPALAAPKDTETAKLSLQEDINKAGLALVGEFHGVNISV